MSAAQAVSPLARTRLSSTGRLAFGLVAALSCTAAILTAIRFASVLPVSAWWQAALHPAAGDPAALVFQASVMPRAAMAILCGAALALAGGLTQAVLANPLAVPNTLGVASGAQLAIIAASLLFPSLSGLPRDIAAMAGGFAAAALVFAVAAAGRFSTLAIVLAGLSISLFCAAFGGVLKLFNHEYLGAIVLWDAGSLVQDDWSGVVAVAPRLGVLALAAAALVRPVELMGLSDEGAKGLGLSLALFRALALGVAVALATIVTATVGIIGFVDLAAPLLVGLAGARRLGPRLVLAAVAGAALLTIVDISVQVLDTRFGTFLPTGTATALLAAPLVIALLPRLRIAARASVAPLAAAPRAGGSTARVLLLLAVVGVLAVLMALLLGRTGAGWAGPHVALLPWRLPRTLAAFGAGTALATAGALLQRVTGNPLSSPESLGLGSAVMVGFAVALLVVPAPSQIALAGAGALSALGLLAILTGNGFRARFAPDHMLLTGVALGAALNALVVAFLALNDARAATLTAWMAGSTAGVGAEGAVVMIVCAVALVPVALLFARPLDLMPLGDPLAKALGVGLGTMRVAIMLLAALLTAGAVLTIGPLTFVGLLGPRLAARLGLKRTRVQIPGAALCGGLVMVLADWAGRVVAAPFEVPAGLMASLIGIPVLIVLLARHDGVA